MPHDKIIKIRAKEIFIDFFIFLIINFIFLKNLDNERQNNEYIQIENQPKISFIGGMSF